MSQFVCFEAEDDDISLENESCQVETISDTKFTDNRVLKVILRLKTFLESDDATGDSFAGFYFSQEPSNYCYDDEICNEVTEFKDSKKRLKSLIKH